jgi:hypothetical protein
LISLAGAIVAGPTGCDSLPGKKREQGAVIGGVGGAAAGAAIAKNNRILGALIGGALGAGGGYLIGVQMDHVKNNDKDAAVQASKNGQSNPATAEQARSAATADINGDGFVTLDEVIAMKKAGFSDDEMIRRLRATNQVFELTPQQEQTLRDAGVTQNVISQMESMNRTETTPAPATQGEVIGHQK